MAAPQSERPPTATGFAPVLVANTLPRVAVLPLWALWRRAYPERSERATE